MSDRVSSQRDAAEILGVSAVAVGNWVRDGRLKPGPWTVAELEELKVTTPRRQAVARHGTVARWRAGCRCEKCLEAHLASHRDSRKQKRIAEIHAQGQAILSDVASGMRFRDWVEKHGTSPTKIRAWRVADPVFGAKLDWAMRAGRDASLRHPSATAWREGCRCPECREWHEASR